MRRLSLVLALALSSSPAFAARAPEWAPITPEERDQKECLVEKGAPAEVLFWEIRGEDLVTHDGDPYSTTTQYLRIKIFDDRGKEQNAKVEIPFRDEDEVTDVAARTIKPDGKIVELEKSAIFERVLLKAGGVKWKAKSFALPAVEPGCIVEYRWKEVSDRILVYRRVDVQREIPVRRLTFGLKALDVQSYGTRSLSFRLDVDPFTSDKDGYQSITLRDIPAFHAEPHDPPDATVKSWFLVFYDKGKQPIGAEFWKKVGTEEYEKVQPRMKTGSAIKKAAAEAVGDASKPDEKLRRIFDFCRAKVKNLAEVHPAPSEDEKKRIRKIKNPADTLEKGIGTTYQIDMLFAALASAAGLDAHYAMVCDRSELSFDERIEQRFFLDSYTIAVKVGDSWSFFDPGVPVQPFGAIRWQEEGQKALVTDAKAPVFVTTPTSGPDASVERRTATLRLSEDGTLEGEVKSELIGHLAAERRSAHAGESPEQWEKSMREGLEQRIGAAELTASHVENLGEPAKPLVVAYHVRVPGYAVRTGKRLFVGPAYFHAGCGALFPASQREHPTYFEYAWSEVDDVAIELPPGFELDEAKAPEPVTMLDFGSYSATLGVENGGRLLRYGRRFSWNRGLTSPTAYRGVKKFFDEVHQKDGVQASLRAGGTK